MSRNSKKSWPYSSSGSSKVIDLGVNEKPICDFLLVIVTLAVSATIFEIFTLEDSKLLILPTPPLFEVPAREPLRISGWNLLAKTRGMALPYGKNFIILTSTVFTALCTLVQSAVLRSHVVCLSVRLFVCLPVCDVGELWSHRMEFFKNNFTIS